MPSGDGQSLTASIDNVDIFTVSITGTSTNGGEVTYSYEVTLLNEMDHLTGPNDENWRSEEHTSELQSLMRISYDVFCLKTNTTRLARLSTAHANSDHNARQILPRNPSHDCAARTTLPAHTNNDRYVSVQG